MKQKKTLLKLPDGYREKQAGLDERFLSAIEEASERVVKYPAAGRIIYKTFRQTSLKKFPYVIVYEMFPGSIIVYAIFHTSRNPKKKLKRLKK